MFRRPTMNQRRGTRLVRRCWPLFFTLLAIVYGNFQSAYAESSRGPQPRQKVRYLIRDGRPVAIVPSPRAPVKRKSLRYIVEVPPPQKERPRRLRVKRPRRKQAIRLVRIDDETFEEIDPVQEVEVHEAEVHEAEQEPTLAPLESAPESEHYEDYWVEEPDVDYQDSFQEDLGLGCGVETMPHTTRDCLSCDKGCDRPNGSPCSGGRMDGQRVPLFLPILPIDWCRFEFFGGAHGFSGPPNFPAGIDRSGTGSFGFHQGFNTGRALQSWAGNDWASQFGMRLTQNNFSGAGFSSDTRNQLFLTGGIFRKVDYGLQLGFVLDFLNDDWYYQANLSQLRGEISWKNGDNNEYGYRFMTGLGNSSSTTRVNDGAGGTVVGTFLAEATAQHRFFYRHHSDEQGTVDAFLGTTDNQDFLLGLNVETPIRRQFDLRVGCMYLRPSEGDGLRGNQEESWNVSLSIVWRPCGPVCDQYSKPLFNVADNGTFLVGRR